MGGTIAVMIPGATHIVSEFSWRRQNARFWLCGLLLSAFVVFALLYWLAPATYLALLRFAGIDAYQTPFLDLHGILAALECKREGIDVMQANPCDALGRPLIYSPLWLAPAVLPVQATWFIPAGLCLDLLFILSLSCLPVVTGAYERTILGLAALSPPTVYALERSNADLIIFLMIVGAVPLLLASWPRRIGGYTIFLLAGFLKYYPLALLLILVREEPKRFWPLAAAAMLAITVFYFWYRPELIESAAVLGTMHFSPYGDSFDFTNLPFGIVELVSRFGAWPAAFGVGPMAVSTVILALLLADGARRAWRINQDVSLGAALAELPAPHALFLMVGATVIVGCFFAGRSNLYRAIFFLMALPGLLALARTTPRAVARRWLRPCSGFVLFLMWSEFLRHVLAQWPPGRLAGAIYVLFWIAKELIWWWVIAVFCGLLLQLVSTTPSGRILTRLPGLRPSTALRHQAAERG